MNTELSNQSIPLIEETPTTEPESSNFMYIGIIAIIIIILAALKLTKSKRKPRNIIAIVGQRFSGKTQLFINLNQGKRMKTVPSIQNNRTIFSLGNKKLQMIDYIGDNISKQQILQKLDEIHTIIHVIDGTDDKTISDASMFLYKVLVSKEYQRENCNYLIFLNKNDLPTFVGKIRLEHKLQDEIEHIKQSRINQGEENESQDDYIKLAKTKFKIPFKIIEGSAESNIKDLQMAIDAL